MAKRGTRAKIDLVELERLSAMQCTDEEVGAWFGVTTRTIERRRKNAKFAEVMNRGRAKILGQVDEIRQELLGHISTQLQIVLPRALNPARPDEAAALDVSHELVEAEERE